MTESQQPSSEHEVASRVSLDDLFRDVAPVHSADELARDGIFEDGEVERFLTDLRAMRHADTA